jgi:hypothetical protein
MDVFVSTKRLALYLIGAIGWVVSCCVPPVTAENVLVDDFEGPNPATYVLNLYNPNPPSTILVKQSYQGALGGERELLAEILGKPSPFSFGAIIGYDETFDRGVLQVATAGKVGSRMALQYDGEDLGDSVAHGLNNAQDLSVDLTGGGTNDRFEMSFAFSDGVDPHGLDIGVIATSPTGGSLTYWGYVANSNDALTRSIRFTEFTVQGEASFGNVNSLMFLFNWDGTANVDFALDSIAAVPEPSTWAMLGTALVVFVTYGYRRRRRRMAQGPVSAG